MTMPTVAHGKAQYAAVNLGKYFDAKGQSRFGLFFLKVKAGTPTKGDDGTERPAADSADGPWWCWSKTTSTARTMCLCSRSKRVEPIKGATVEVLGKNGVAIQSETSDAEGRFVPEAVRFRARTSAARVSGQQGRRSVVLPYGGHDRYLDFRAFPSTEFTTVKSRKDCKRTFFRSWNLSSR